MRRSSRLCVFFRTILCTRSSISSSGSGCLPSPSSPSYISSIGQHPIILFRDQRSQKEFPGGIFFFFRKQHKIAFYVTFQRKTQHFVQFHVLYVFRHFCCKLANVANYAFFCVICLPQKLRLCIWKFLKKNNRFFDKYQAYMLHHLLCRVCLLSLPAFRVLVTKTWSSCKNLSKPLKFIKHNSFPYWQINYFSI